jgi:hypothetical protein
LREGRELPGVQRTRFEAGHEGQYTKQLDRALPGTHTRRLYDNLKRDEAQIVARLRTGKIRLNSALYRINAADSDLCEWCQRPETVRHYIVECSQWTAERRQYLHAATARWCDVSYLLGGWFNERLDGPRNKWKANMKAIRAVIDFVKATGRLQMSTEER